jgi:small conductance mechanosensitive channel
MRDWLSSIRPEPWMIETAATAGRVALVLLLSFIARGIMLRGLRVAMLPLLARARAEGESHEARLRTLEGLTRSAISYGLLFIAAVTVLGLLRVDITPVLTTVGLGGLAVSFGAQRLVRVVLTGFFFLMEDQFRVGETVSLLGIPGQARMDGTVADMGLRITQLRDAAGQMITVSNGDIGAVVNHSRGPVTAAVELGVPPDVPLERLREAVAEASLPEELFSGPIEVRGVSAVDGARALIRIAAPAQPGRAPEAELALRDRVAAALRAAGIEIR